MECQNFIWETTLSFLTFKECIGLRLLSKTFDVLVLRSMNEFVVGEEDESQEEMISRFGPYVKHLFLDASCSSVSFIIEYFKNITSLSLRKEFCCNTYDSRDWKAKNHGLVQITQRLKLENIFILIELNERLVLELIAKKDLSSFAYEFDDCYGGPENILEELSFLKLITLSISNIRYEKWILEIIKNKDSKLQELELDCANIYENERFFLPEIPCLKVLRINFEISEDDELEDAYLCLNNPQNLPNIRKLDIFRGEYGKLRINDIAIWPQITSLRLFLTEFQEIDFKKYFPNLNELSYDLQDTSEAEAHSFLNTISHVKSLFIFCPHKLTLTSPVYLENLTRLSLTFTSNINSSVLKYFSKYIPNLTELSVTARVDYFQRIYLKKVYQLNSLLRFSLFEVDSSLPDQEFSSTFWPKIMNEAPKLKSIHSMDWVLLRKEFSSVFPQVIFSPHYNMEKDIFPVFTEYYH